MKKKLLTIILIIALTIVSAIALTACGEKKGGGTTGGGTTGGGTQDNVDANGIPLTGSTITTMAGVEEYASTYGAKTKYIIYVTLDDGEGYNYECKGYVQGNKVHWVGKTTYVDEDGIAHVENDENYTEVDSDRWQWSYYKEDGAWKKRKDYQLSEGEPMEGSVMMYLSYLLEGGEEEGEAFVFDATKKAFVYTDEEDGEGSSYSIAFGNNGLFVLIMEMFDVDTRYTQTTIIKDFDADFTVTLPNATIVNGGGDPYQPPVTEDIDISKFLVELYAYGIPQKGSMMTPEMYLDLYGAADNYIYRVTSDVVASACMEVRFDGDKISVEEDGNIRYFEREGEDYYEYVELNYGRGDYERVLMGGSPFDNDLHLVSFFIEKFHFTYDSKNKVFVADLPEISEITGTTVKFIMAFGNVGDDGLCVVMMVMPNQIAGVYVYEGFGKAVVTLPVIE